MRLPQLDPEQSQDRGLNNILLSISAFHVYLQSYI